MIEINPYLFRNYDIRGAEPEYVKSETIIPGSLRAKSAYACPLTKEIAYAIGRAVAQVFKFKRMAVGGDIRRTTPMLKKGIIQGLLDGGIDVTDIGLSSTDMLYFAIGYYNFEGGIQVTASHTIKELNGFKISRLMPDGNVFPVGIGSGMEELRDAAIKQEFEDKEKGNLTTKAVLLDFCNFIRNIVDAGSFKHFKIVMDPGNGCGGFIAKELFKDMNVDIIPLNFEPDGEFPVHNPNPALVENRKEVSEKIKETNADLGIMWDGDSDRVCFLDENGEFIPNDFVTAVLSEWVIEKHPNARIIYTVPMSWSIPEKVAKLGGISEMTPVGNTFVKQAMHNHNAVFGGEQAGHYMFKETFNAETGFLPVLIILDRLTRNNKKMSELFSEYTNNFFLSGDTNIEIKNSDLVLKKLEEHYSDATNKYRLDGLSIEYPDWHFNARPSSNDPVIRLNIEAKNRDLMLAKQEEIKGLVKEYDK